mmetsp:Transcript_6550/g.13508  ORF Transcript_6550/g.13508 Transcript_6550/m.13508 type:complete len:383 (-) Transcript_6550:1550-2698(-)|eukprot:CAMPEP_0201269278 /NCGR_PEP_ID=MMETSP0853-20130426/32133_1 /ASSEMBLY_ACC=CAM_ASM_000640 /TAXON_ID=183588 /ORGANISM="Pseudo-nitzschia fraudulenta, Strain WWA7" /LENGTH=382 /DNA_ID=CAMNT_0047575237 /DNA_START=473 /DNA_END=1621 /DNA_ORIENTATION=+
MILQTNDSKRSALALAAIAFLLSVSVFQTNSMHVAEAFTVGEVTVRGVSSGSALLLSQTTTDSSETDGITEKSIPSPLPERKIALLLCPAQFCVPADYSELWETLPFHIDVDSNEAGATQKIAIDKDMSRVVPLSRRDWIKVAKQLPTKNFIDANLRVHETLDWYFEAIEEGLSAIIDADSDIDGVCLVGHSIGGWVARAYLGGLARSSTAVSKAALEKNLISSMITLGTPHESPDTALVDQTRGLLREIAETPSCSSSSLVNERGIDITCVCSSSLPGNFLTTNVEEFVAACSYLPLLGKTDASVKGDGIVPLDLAFMEEPAQKIVLPECPATGRPIRHIHVLPTPWNLWDASAGSIRLDDADATSYVSPDIVAQWAQYIR